MVHTLFHILLSRDLPALQEVATHIHGKRFEEREPFPLLPPPVHPEGCGLGMRQLRQSRR